MSDQKSDEELAEELIEQVERISEHMGQLHPPQLYVRFIGYRRESETLLVSTSKTFGPYFAVDVTDEEIRVRNPATGDNEFILAVSGDETRWELQDGIEEAGPVWESFSVESTNRDEFEKAFRSATGLPPSKDAPPEELPDTSG